MKQKRPTNEQNGKINRESEETKNRIEESSEWHTAVVATQNETEIKTGIVLYICM